MIAIPGWTLTLSWLAAWSAACSAKLAACLLIVALVALALHHCHRVRSS